MEFDPSRLRRGELLAAASAVLLTIFLVGGKWYGGAGGTGGSLTGWQALTDLRWLLLVTILAALGLAFMQATRRAPAVPVTMSLIVMLLGIVSVARAHLPRPDRPARRTSRRARIWALLFAIGIACGGYAVAPAGGHRAAGTRRRDIPTRPAQSRQRILEWTRRCSIVTRFSTSPDWPGSS